MIIPSTMCEQFIEDADKVLSHDDYTKLINPKLSVILKDGKKQTRYIYKAEDESLYWTVAEDVLKKFPENIMIYTTGRNSMAYVFFTWGDPLGVMMPIREDKAEQIYNSLD